MEQGEMNFDLPMPEIKVVDISKMEPAVKKYFMLLSANILLIEAKALKSIKEIKKNDIAAQLEPAIAALKKTKIDGLPDDYKSYMEGVINIMDNMMVDIKALPKGKEVDLAAFMMIMMKCKPAMDALDKKYPECSKMSKCIEHGEASIYKNFKLEEKVQAYTKKIKDKGETDEKVIKIRSMRAAAKTLRNMAAEIK